MSRRTFDCSLVTNIKAAKDTPMLPVYGKSWATHEKQDGIILDRLTNEIVKRSFAVNAKLPGIKIVPGPMGTGGGYLFSAIDAVAEKKHIPHQKGFKDGRGGRGACL